MGEPVVWSEKVFMLFSKEVIASTLIGVGLLLGTLSAKEPGEPETVETKPEGDAALDELLSDVHVEEETYFFVVATDADAAKYVSRLCEEMTLLAARYLAMPSRFRREVLIQLVPVEEAGFRAPYRVSTTDLGEVIVSIRWDEQTAFSMVCQAVARGFLQGWVAHYYGQEALEKTPPWLDIALGLRLQTSVQPRFRDFLKQESTRLPTLSLIEVTAPDAAQKHSIELLGLHAYWLFELVRSETNRRDFSYFLDAVVRGIPTMEAIDKLVADKAERSDDFLWWAVGFQDQVHTQQGALMPLEQAREELLRFSTITVEINGADENLDLRGIWQYRHKATVQAAISWRLREIKLALNRFNPVYYNALHSLGRLYETYLTPESERFLEFESIYLSDLKRAQRLDRFIVQQLDRIETAQ